MILWKGDRLFELDGVSFRLDFGPPEERRPSSRRVFSLVKAREVVETYMGLQEKHAKEILEFGIGEGGSSVFFEKIFRPRRLVAVDNSIKRIPALDAYLENNNGIIKPYFGTEQEDRARVVDIIASEFPTGIDFIVDDASHMYEQTKATFETCFPHLRPGGLYVVEDWSWSHEPASQSPEHPWFRKAALTNLVVDCIVATGCRSIAKLEILPFLIIAHKGGESASPVLDWHHRLRGRKLNQI